MSRCNSCGLNSFKLIGVICLMVSFAFLTGCSMPSNSAYMTVSKADLNPDFVKKKCQYSNNVCIGKVEGGKETNPIWVSTVSNTEYKNALEKSLHNVDFYNPKTEARYLLNAKLEKLQQPLIGLNFTVTCQSHYQIYDQKLKKVVFEQTLKTPYTATFGSSLLAVERLKKANEGAIKENIKDLVNNLYNS